MLIKSSFLVLFFVLQICNAAPMGKRCQVDREEIGPGKRCKSYQSDDDEVVPNSQPDESFERSSGHKCFFSQEHLSPAETKPRPLSSKVGTDCSDQLKSMTNYIDDNNGNMYGGSNKADLILCRGAGECDIDWNNQLVVNEWGATYICSSHEAELLSRWNTNTYKHIFRRMVKRKIMETCSMPEEVGEVHQTRPNIHKKRFELQLDEYLDTRQVSTGTVS